MAKHQSKPHAENKGEESSSLFELMIKRLEGDKETLQAQNKKLLEEKNAWGNEKAQLQKDLQEAQDDNLRVREQISQLENEKSQKAQENGRLAADLQSLNKTLKGQNDENKRLRDELKDGIIERQRASNELHKTRGEIDILQDELREKTRDGVHSNPEEEDSPAESVQTVSSIPQVSPLPERSITAEPEPAQKSRADDADSKPGIDHPALMSTLTTLTLVAEQLHEQLQPIKADLERVQSLEKDLIIQKDRIRNYDRDKNKLKTDLARSEQQLRTTRIDIGELQQKLAQTQQEKEELQKSIQIGNQVIESLNEQLAQLREKMSQEKHLVGIEWAQELAPILTKLSSLAELEPEPVINLKPRSIYEMFLDWMEKVFGERPKPFPGKRELSGEDTNNPEISLDLDQDNLETLLKLYDWSPDHPFEGLPEGSRRRGFRVLHWGWKVSGNVLVKARVSPLPIKNTSEVRKEESHDI